MQKRSVIPLVSQILRGLSTLNRIKENLRNKIIKFINEKKINMYLEASLFTF